VVRELLAVEDFGPPRKLQLQQCKIWRANYKIIDGLLIA
jgi:hypothetical protein